MSDAELATTELKTQYGAQVAADLERNAKEQENVAAEVAALQERLRALQHDHAMLVNLQQTLGSEPVAAAGPAKPNVEEISSAGPSVPRQGTADTASTGPKKAVVGVGTKRRATTEAKQPTLVEVIRRHLALQSEPRSAAEITTALTQAHPERDIKPKVVRTTVEGLVAKGHVHRTKQGSSVFYTASQPESVDESAEETAPVAS
jgi:endonuclease/exonuclease/phosphatase family metal-dependent hydrolase